MQQLIELGTTPTEENCAQLGSETYEENSLRECLVFKRMLLRTSPPPSGAQLIVKTFAHDCGHYREVCVRFDDAIPSACDYAYNLEAHGPMKWDAVAAYELSWFERRAAFHRGLRAGDISESELPAQYQRAEPPPEIAALPTASAAELFTRFPI